MANTGSIPVVRNAAAHLPPELLGWHPDVLPGFERLTLPLEPDDEGEVVATLVRRAKAKPGLGVDVLYLHGWTDYFHQVHLAEFFENLGCTFYALDLRKYGRSLRPWQTPGFITSLRTYASDINAALTQMGHQVHTHIEHDDAGLFAPNPTSAEPEKPPKRTLVLMGHSTGGLIVSLYAVGHPGVVDALILNSPWLEFQTGAIGRRALEGPIRAQALIAPMSGLVKPDAGYYVRSVSSKYEGEWPLIEEWRPDEGWKPTAAWLNAIFRGQERVAQGLDLKIPVLVLLSAKSTVPTRWKPELKRADAVLTVAEVAQRSPSLAQTVTTVRLDGAMHDVTLSTASVRTVLWEEMTRWVRAYVPVPTPALDATEPSGGAQPIASSEVVLTDGETSASEDEAISTRFWEAFGRAARRTRPNEPWRSD